MQEPMIRRALGVASGALLAFDAAAYQRSSGERDVAACATCGTCGTCWGVLIVVPVVILAVNVALLVWVARDAKARGMDSAVIWMLLVMFTSVIGLILYIFSRPQGNLVRCARCNNSRLQASAQCPHCGNP